MLTRRAVLTGTAGVSIAAIASAAGVASAGDSNGSGDGFGNVAGGAAGSFHKRKDGFGVFLKWDGSAAEIFYKEQAGVVGLFAKTFLKGWSKVPLNDLAEVSTLEGATASFNKVHTGGAEFFLKYKNGIEVKTTFTAGSEGVDIEVQESNENND